MSWVGLTTGEPSAADSRLRVESMSSFASRCAAVADDLLEHVPHLGTHALDDALGALDVVGKALLHELAHDERLEQLERHLLGQPALVQLELRADHDDRAPGVVDALAEQVLAE